MKKYALAALFATGLLTNCQAQDTFMVGETELVVNDLITGMSVPWEIIWGPDNHIWVTERSGRVKRIDPTNGESTTILNISSSIFGGGEPGLLGMALHPNFDTEPYVYLAYTYGSFQNASEKLVRYTWDGSELTNEETLFDDIEGGGIHNGSRLLITSDGYLLMTTGDTGNTSLSQNMNSNNGKTLRLNLDGSIPDDNPIPGSAIWSFGHRNSQGLCEGPTGIIYSSEHGQSNSDELNIIEMNGNYGWPAVEGVCNTVSEQNYCTNNDVQEPIDEWSPCVAVNGLEYYNHPAIPGWQNSLLLSVLGGFVYDERLSVLQLNEDGTEIVSETEYFHGAMGGGLNYGQRVRDICIDPNTGSVYVALNGPDYPGSGPNRIFRIANPEFVESVNETLDLADVQLFPNPASDVVNVTIDQAFLNKTYQLVSATGQIMQTARATDLTMQIDVSDYESGYYYLLFEEGDSRITRSFIKQ